MTLSLNSMAPDIARFVRQTLNRLLRMGRSLLSEEIVSHPLSTYLERTSRTTTLIETRVDWP